MFDKVKAAQALKEQQKAQNGNKSPPHTGNNQGNYWHKFSEPDLCEVLHLLHAGLYLVCGQF